MRETCDLSGWTGQPGHCQWCDQLIEPGRRRTWCTDTCRRQWERNHVWRQARIYARKHAKYQCSRPGCTAARMDIEINHITPRVGQGYGPGCHHHQSPAPDGTGGLEALCHAHHVAVTNDQRAARQGAKHLNDLEGIEVPPTGTANSVSEREVAPDLTAA